MNFSNKIERMIKKNNSLLCVGLDTDKNAIPKHLLSLAHPLFEFNKAIVDATHTLVCSYKLNSAFYEGEGKEGIEQLKMTCDYIRSISSQIPIILDAKRADIGNTNRGYVKYAFEYLMADALTLHPYLGKESLEPFLELQEKGFFILCKTSNGEGGEIQDLLIDGRPLYSVIASKVAHEWNVNGNCMLVIAGTYPKELQEIRSIVGDMILLVPGIGKQGGDVQSVVSCGLSSQKRGLIIHAARSIIFASDRKDFAEKTQKEALKLKETINQYRFHSS